MILSIDIGTTKIKAAIFDCDSNLIPETKLTVDTPAKDNTNTLQEYTTFVDKLTGNSRYQGKHGEKLLEKID